MTRERAPTLGIVVLDGDDAAAGRLGALEQSGAVDGLDGERVDDAHVDAGLGQRVGRLHGVHQRDASAHHRHLVARALPHHLSTDTQPSHHPSAYHCNNCQHGEHTTVGKVDGWFTW